MTAARICVPPRSSASTGRGDRGGPRGYCGRTRILAKPSSDPGCRRGTGGRGPPPAGRPPRPAWGAPAPPRPVAAIDPLGVPLPPGAQEKTPVVADGGLDLRPGTSAADLEDLAATLGAGALQGRLAVLHRDLLRVLDFDLHLVLDAVGFRHSGLLLGLDERCGNPCPASTQAVRAGSWVHSDGRQRSVDAACFWASSSARTSRLSSPTSTQAASAASLTAPSTNAPVVLFA